MLPFSVSSAMEREIRAEGCKGKLIFSFLFQDNRDWPLTRRKRRKAIVMPQHKPIMDFAFNGIPLERFLEDHKRWVETKGIEGERAVLSGGSSSVVGCLRRS